MEFAAVILLLTFYFIHPQDWVPGMAGLNVVKPIIAMAILGMVSRRRNARHLPWRFMRTPHEWIMVVYAAYILVSAPSPGDVAGDMLPLVVFFFLTLHSITSVERLDSFLKWWRWSLIGVAIMALGVVVGVDFTQSATITDQNAGRLALNHWNLNNPNALGHTLITLFPLLYFGVIRDRRRGRFITRLISVLIPAAIASVCLWKTQSKGAYLVGAGMIVFAILLGRPWWLKVAIISLAIAGGGTVLSVLPRMNELSHLKSDEGVVGRIMVWQMARGVTRNTVSGEGYKRFAAHIRWEGRMIPKATHSSYVQIGGDLGLPGLLLYLSVLCCGLRTLFSYYGYSEELDRLRGALFALLLGYVASGWMINRSYQTEFFLLIGAIAAYQQLCLRAAAVARHEEAAVPAAQSQVAAARPKRRQRTTGKGAFARWMPPWRRYGILDAACACIALQMVLWIWDYAISTF